MAESENKNCKAPASTSSQDADHKASDDEYSSDEKETKPDEETNSNTPSKTEGDGDQENGNADGSKSNEHAKKKRRKSKRRSVVTRARNAPKDEAEGKASGEAQASGEKRRSIDGRRPRRSRRLKDGDDDDDDEEEDDDDSDGEQKWQIVTPEMIMETLGRNSHWHSTSTIEDIVSYLRSNYPVCQNVDQLTMEVTDKLTCAEEIGLVIKECTTDKKKERIIFTYRMASPLEKTYLSEWEIKEFWSHYREILRRSKRIEKARYTARASRLNRNGASRTGVMRRRTRGANVKKYRRRSAYSQYSSDDSVECGKDCCCRK